MKNFPQDMRIALTRSAADNGPWLRALAERGLAGIDLPCIQTQVLDGAAAQLERKLQDCDSLLFSSARAVAAVNEICPQFDLSQKPCVCVGEASARAVRSAGGQVAWIAPGGTALSLGQAWILRRPAHIRPLWPRAQEVQFDLVALFEQHGRELQNVPVYRTLPRTDMDRGALSQAQAIFFASPSAVHALLATGPLAPHALLISMGPSTSAALAAHGLKVSAQAPTRCLDGMLSALEQATDPHKLSH